MTAIFISRLITSASLLPKPILFKNDSFFKRRTKRVNLVTTPTKLIQFLSLRKKIKKTNFQLDRCFLKNKQSVSLIKNKNSKNLYKISINPIVNSLKNNTNTYIKIYSNDSKKPMRCLPNLYALENKIFYSNPNQTSIKGDKNKTMQDSLIKKNQAAKKKNYLLQHFNQLNVNTSVPFTFKFLQRSRSLNHALIMGKLKLKKRHLSLVSLKKHYLEKETVNNNLFLEKLKDKTIFSFRERKRRFNTRLPVALPSPQQTSTLMQNILYLNTTIKEASVIAHKTQETKSHDSLAKLDKRLSYIQNIIEEFIQTKQNEITHLTFNPFNEKRKKTYSDFL